MRLAFSGVAKEKLKNNSVCVNDDEYIRNTNNYEDIIKEKLVFVSNVDPIDMKIDYIEAGSTVRYITI